MQEEGKLEQEQEQLQPEPNTWHDYLENLGEGGESEQEEFEQIDSDLGENDESKQESDESEQIDNPNQPDGVGSGVVSRVTVMLYNHRTTIACVVAGILFIAVAM